MRGVALVAGLALASAASDAAAGRRQAAGITPVQKVIELLNGMIQKGKKEKYDEQKQFAAYKAFCDDTSKEKQHAIKDANEAIEMLTADFQKYTSDAEQLSKAIATHDQDIATWEGDLKASTKVREIENTAYLATHKDYTESIQALEEAIATLKQQAHDTKQAAASLLQVARSPLVPKESQRLFFSFIEKEPEDENLAESAPQANAIDFASQGIIDMLQKLLDKFEDERETLEKDEKSAVNSFEMLTQDLNAQVGGAKEARSEKAEAKAKAVADAADAKGDLADTTTTRDDDTKYLSDLTATCEAKAAAFEERQQLRAEEIAAVQKATEILSSGAVAGAAAEHLPALVQTRVSLAQLRSSMPNELQLRVSDFLRHQGEKLNSRMLSTLSVRVSADPFKKIRKMIKDLVIKLMEEAQAETEAKGFCDTELEKNKQTRKEKTEAVETLQAEIDELTASIASLTQEIQELTKAVAELDASVSKATDIREAEKEKNANTIKDAQEAQAAVAQALTVLKNFYAKAEEATALVQQEPPEIFDEPYRGMGAENGGVVGMIEVIQSDFARLEAETTSGEAEGQKEYEDFMADSSVDKMQKTSDIEHKSGKKQNQEQALQEKKNDLDSTQKELDAAMLYYEKLKPSCVDSGVSYDERVARRQEEIDSLKEALNILEGEDIALLQKEVRLEQQ